MKFGKTSYNPIAFKETKKSEFMKTYAGSGDLENAWKWIQKNLPKKSKNESRKSDKEV